MQKIERLCDWCTGIFVCENEKEEKTVATTRWGHDQWELTRDEIETLFSGKILVIDDGEYTHAIKFKEDTP